MKTIPVLLAATLCGLGPSVKAAHITDRLLAGLYDEPDASGEPVRLLESGTPVEALERRGELIRVRLSDDTTGWVEEGYVTDRKPTGVRLLELQAEAGELRRRLAAAERALAQAEAAPEKRGGSAPGAGTVEPAAANDRTRGRGPLQDRSVWHYLILCAALLIGFSAGFAVYDYRLRRRLGGFRI